MLTRFSKTELALFAFGTIVLLCPLFPLPFSVSMTGHPWKMELVSAIVLTLLLALFAYRRYWPDAGERVFGTMLLMTAFLAWGWISIIWAGSNWSVFHHTFVWVCYLVAFSVISNLAGRRNGVPRILVFLSGFAAILAILMLLGYLQVVVNPEYEERFRVTYSKFSEILVILTPLLFVIGSFRRDRSGIICAVISALSFLAIVVSLSRTSFISVVAGLVFAASLLLIFVRNKPTIIRAFAILGCLALLFAASQLIPTGSENESTLTARFSSKSSYQTSSGDIRRLLLGVSGEMVRANPVRGVGADNFGLEINKYRAAYARRNPENPELKSGQELLLERAHNEFAQVLAELGIVGFLLFAGFLGWSGYLFILRMRSSRSQLETVIRIAAFSGASAFLVSSLASSFSFRALQNGYVFFVVLALAIAPYRKPETDVRRWFALIALPFGLVSIVLFAIQVSSGIYTARAERTESMDASLTLFEKARYLNSTNAAADMSTGIRYFNEKEPKKAIPYFREAINKGGGVIATYYFLAESQRLSGDMDGGRETSRECARIFAASPFARVMYADFLTTAGMKSKASEELADASEIDPGNAETWRSIFSSSALETSIKARTDKRLIPLDELQPNSVVQAVIGKEKIYSDAPNP